MNLVLLKGYNNYFNRRFKYDRYVSGYKNAASSYDELENYNFNPNDGVRTTIVVGNTVLLEGNYDYLLVVNPSEGPFVSAPNSRWFVIDSKRTRLGQYELTLKRDSVADKIGAIRNAPMFVQKGIITNENNPLLFNREGMTYNEIKQSELLLQDKSKCAWIVGYIPRDAYPSGQKVSAYIRGIGTADETVNHLSDWQFYNYTTGNTALELDTVRINIAGFGSVTPGDAEIFQYNTFTWNKNSCSINPQVIYMNPVRPSRYNSIVKDANGTYSELFDDTILTAVKSKCSFGGQVLLSKQQKESLMATNHKIIYDMETQTYYEVSIEHTDIAGTAPTGYLNINANDLSSLSDWIVSYDGRPTVEYVKTTVIKVSLIPLKHTVECTITPSASRYHLEDSPYDMFCIPYGDDVAIHIAGGATITANKIAGLAIATEICKASGDVYDLQLLPYCPIQSIILSDGIHPGEWIRDSITDAQGTVINYLFWCNKSNFSFNITNDGDPILEIPLINNDIALSMKVSNECDKYRLCSPNWSNFFDFSLAKNGGTVMSFNVDCSYKPFSPYIHINPDFKGLYGRDFNDARGLICGGDFSLPQVTSAWETYERNNKNYQNIFDRQMQNLDIQNKYARESDIVNMISGVLGAGMSGGATAGIMGAGPVGMAIGAGIGAGASVVGGIRDLQIKEELRKENKNLQIDMFNYQLGNIQAIPLSLTKVSAFTYNNKLWPVVEYYTCTETEKQALINKITYEGMTIMTIGTMNEYNTGYIKGEIIRLDDLVEDTHMANDIYNELLQGLYLGG